MRQVTIQIVEKLFSEFKKLQNTSGSYRPIRLEDRDLQAQLRNPQEPPNALDHVQQLSLASPQPIVPPTPILEEERKEVQVDPRVNSQVHCNHVSLPLVPQRALPQENVHSDTSDKRSRAPKKCSNCGRERDLPPWNQYDSEDFCTTPISEYSLATRSKKRKRC